MDLASLSAILTYTLWSTFGIARSLEACPGRKEFQPIPPTTWSASTLITKYSLLSHATCERTCRQYLDCRAYTLQLYQNTTQGTCRLYRDVDLEPHSPGDKPALFYGVCPFDGTRTYCRSNVWYHVNTVNKEWDAAVIDCKTWSPTAHLVELNTQQKFNDVTQIAGHAGLASFYTAAVRSPGSRYVYVWSHSGAVIPSLSWGPDEPDRGKEERYLILDTSWQSYWAWHDINPGYAWDYICEL